MPYGLYSWNGSLFVLRHVVDRGERLWFLDKVDPASGKLEGTVQIRSTAKHLLLVPGPKNWALVEKGDFIPRTQWSQVEDVRLMPTSRLMTKSYSGVVCQ